MMRKIVDNYSGRTMMLNGEDYDTLALLENRAIANYRHLLDGMDLLAIDEADVYKRQLLEDKERQMFQIVRLMD